MRLVMLPFFPAEDAHRKCRCGQSAPAAEGNASTSQSALDEEQTAGLNVATEA